MSSYLCKQKEWKMEEEYVSIQEFAKFVGVSNQAVYQRLGKSLKPFVKVIER